jgi:Hsp20/alpha crystallin family/PIN like domain
MSLRAAQVRFYIDADVLGLGKLLAGLRSDVTYPGDPGAVIHKRQRAPCPIMSPDVLDTDWIPQVAARGWLIITRDSMITTIRAERAPVKADGAQLIVAERPSGTFTRQVFLGETLDADNITADYAAGVLTLTIPVREQAKPRSIQVTSSDTKQAVTA